MNPAIYPKQLESLKSRKTILGVAKVSFLLFLILAFVVRLNGFDEIDHPIMLFVYEFRTSALTETMKWITSFGKTGLIFIVLLTALILFFKRHLRQALWFLVLVFGGAVANAVIKISIARPRPSLSPLITETDFSFPSGHSMDSLIVYGAIAYLLLQFLPKSRYRRFVTPIAVLIIAAIGFSRIYLGVHYPSDVLAGYLFGAGWLLIGTYYYANFFDI